MKLLAITTALMVITTGIEAKVVWQSEAISSNSGNGNTAQRSVYLNNVQSSIGLERPQQQQSLEEEDEIVSFAGHKVYRLQVTTKDQLESLHRAIEHPSLGLDAWTNVGYGSVDVRVPPASHARFQEQFSSLSMDLMIPDLEHQVTRERNAMSDYLTTAALSFPSSGAQTQFHFAKMVKQKPQTFFESYHTYDYILNWMEEMKNQYPELVELYSIGKTFEEREIIGMRIVTDVATKNGDPKRGVMFHGAEHAREWISPAVMTYIAHELLTKYGKEDAITAMVDAYEWNIIPVLNIDGYVFSHKNNRMWRKNRQPHGFCKGTDPNRNWDAQWNYGGGASSFPCSETYQGPAPFSAPEAAAIAAELGRRPGHYLAYIDFHAYSQLWMHPFGYDCKKAPKSSPGVVAAAVAASEGLEAVYGKSFAVQRACDLYPVTGASIDYAYGTLKIPYAYAVELRDKGKYGFMLPADQIIPSGEETMAGVVSMIEEIGKIEAKKGAVEEKIYY